MVTKSDFPLESLVEAIDAKDADRFVGFLTDEAVFRYGRQAPVAGKSAVRDYVAGFFTTVAALRHRVLDTWEREGSLVWQCEVTYTHHDGAVETVPFVNVFRVHGGRIREYLIYI
jgi:ketosteroid isomerase-like protein